MEVQSDAIKAPMAAMLKAADEKIETALQSDAIGSIFDLQRCNRALSL